MACGRLAFLGISMALLCSASMATDYVVGDDKGWTIDQNYTQWTKGKVFHVGDNLVFKYNSSKHNVFNVDESTFQNCTTPSGNPLDTGNDTIPLNSTGKKWYICGIDDHCSAHKMKLVIDVAGDTPAGVPPASPAPSPGTSAARAVVSSFYRVFTAAIVAIAAIFF